MTVPTRPYNSQTWERPVESSLHDWWDRTGGRRRVTARDLSLLLVVDSGVYNALEDFNREVEAATRADKVFTGMRKVLKPTAKKPPEVPSTSQGERSKSGTRKVMAIGAVVLFAFIAESSCDSVLTRLSAPSIDQKLDLATDKVLGDTDLLRQFGLCAPELTSMAELERIRADKYSASKEEHTKNAAHFEHGAMLAIDGDVACLPQTDASRHTVSVTKDKKSYDVLIDAQDITSFSIPDLCTNGVAAGGNDDVRVIGKKLLQDQAVLCN